MNLRLLEKKALIQVRAYIDEHYKEPISIKALSNRRWSDPSNPDDSFVIFPSVRLRKGFKLLFLQTIHEYQTNLKMETVKMLLTKTDLSVKAIAITVGYKGAKKLSPIFKKHFGLTPTKYRNQFLNDL